MNHLFLVSLRIYLVFNAIINKVKPADALMVIELSMVINKLSANTKSNDTYICNLLITIGINFLVSRYLIVTIIAKLTTLAASAPYTPIKGIKTKQSTIFVPAP